MAIQLYILEKSKLKKVADREGFEYFLPFELQSYIDFVYIICGTFLQKSKILLLTIICFLASLAKSLPERVYILL